MRPRETGIRALPETCDAFPGGLVRANLRTILSLKPVYQSPAGSRHHFVSLTGNGLRTILSLMKPVYQSPAGSRRQKVLETNVIMQQNALAYSLSLSFAPLPKRTA